MLKEMSLSRYTPSMLPHETLEAILVQRHELIDRLVDNVKTSALTGNKHYNLLIGPRGIGKTHMVSLVYHRVSKLEELTGQLAIAWLHEEEWGVASFLDLLLCILRALYEEYKDKDLEARCTALRKQSMEEAEAQAKSILLEWLDKRTLLILAENLDEIFNGLRDDGEQKLRAYIQNNPVFTIVATSQSLFNGVSVRESPFYGFFEIQYLSEFSFDDALSLLTNIATYREDKDLAKYTQTPEGRSRLRAVQHLAGGNPRVYIIFSQFLTCESLDQLVDPLMKTLDDLTPYYQARMSYLTPQQRKVIEFLCEKRGAVSVSEIAQANFIPHPSASGQLKRLKELGYVRSHERGRESYYELREPLMRIALEVKHMRGETIKLLVEFLKLWYSRNELTRRLELLGRDATAERKYLTQALDALDREPEEPCIKASTSDYMTHFEHKDYGRALQVADELIQIRGSAFDWARRAKCLVKLGRDLEADTATKQAIELRPMTLEAVADYFSALLLLDKYEDILDFATKNMEPDLDGFMRFFMRGVALSCLYRHREAAESLSRAARALPGEYYSHYLLFEQLYILGRYNEALETVDESIRLEPDYAPAWKGKAMTLTRLGCLDSALVSFDRVIELTPAAADFTLLSQRADILMALGRWDEGRTAMEHALDTLNGSSAPEDTGYLDIVPNLLMRTQDESIWRKHIDVWLQLFTAHGLVSILKVGVLSSIIVLADHVISNTAAVSWGRVWQESTREYKEMTLLMRLLAAAVEYRATLDDRVLLRLPVEERRVLEPLIKDFQKNFKIS